MAKNTLVRAKMLKVNPQFHADIDAHPASHPLQFVTKNNLRIQKATLALSLCVQLTSLHSFLWYPVINRKTKFAFAIKALVILSVLYWQTIIMLQFKFNQMMHFYKINTFYRNQSLQNE